MGKEFPGVVALDGVRLKIRPGTVHALMGENGAGKSTLMKIIAGVYQPDTGEIRLKGKYLKLPTPLAALDAGIAMIHQELNLMPYMTVAENVWIRREPMKGLGFMDFVDHTEMRRMTEHGRVVVCEAGLDERGGGQRDGHLVQARLARGAGR